jgi:EAL domain-containing protein (putative c-di-GMP-specific phosphodiesterase class I)
VTSQVGAPPADGEPVPARPDPSGVPEDVAAQLSQLLHRARTVMEMPVAFITRMDGTTQTLEHVDSALPLLFQEGHRAPQADTLCQHILDGELPRVLPDLTEHPTAMALPSARMPRIRSYASVPIELSDGTLYGTLCTASLRKNPGAQDRDADLLTVLAQTAAVLVEPHVTGRSRDARIRARYEALIEGGGPAIVAQPIVSLVTGERVGAETLSRFPPDWGMAPDACFREAFAVGIGEDLEFATLARCGLVARRAVGYVSMNVCPDTVLDPRFPAFMAAQPLPRIVLELSEGYPVEDYDLLLGVLRPLRQRELRLAIDDVGAGFSSLRHVIRMSPDVIKLDREVVTGLDADPVARSLVQSLCAFAGTAGATVVAEGVETEGEARALASVGAHLAQGWFFGRPGPVELLEASAGEVADEVGAAPA